VISGKDAAAKDGAGANDHYSFIDYMGTQDNGSIPFPEYLKQLSLPTGKDAPSQEEMERCRLAFADGRRRNVGPRTRLRRAKDAVVGLRRLKALTRAGTMSWLTPKSLQTVQVPKAADLTQREEDAMTELAAAQTAAEAALAAKMASKSVAKARDNASPPSNDDGAIHSTPLSPAESSAEAIPLQKGGLHLTDTPSPPATSSTYVAETTDEAAANVQDSSPTTQPCTKGSPALQRARVHKRNRNRLSHPGASSAASIGAGVRTTSEPPNEVI